MQEILLHGCTKKKKKDPKSWSVTKFPGNEQ